MVAAKDVERALLGRGPPTHRRRPVAGRRHPERLRSFQSSDGSGHRVANRTIAAAPVTPPDRVTSSDRVDAPRG